MIWEKEIQRENDILPTFTQILIINIPLIIEIYLIV